MLVRSLIFLSAAASFVCAGPAAHNAVAQGIDRETVAGGVVGSIIGGVVGNQNDETPEGIAIGGVVGAIAGNLLGKANDRAVAQDQYLYQQRVQQQQQIRHAEQQFQQAQFQRAVSIDDAISLSRNGVSPGLIINQIQANGVQQEIGVQEIILMSQNGVNESVIDVMQKSSVGGGAIVDVARSVIVDQRPVVVEHRPVVVAQPSPIVIQSRPVHRGPGPHGGHRGYYPSRQARGPGYGGPGYGGTVRFGF